jgi:histidinol-phosphate aminotransferase
MNDQSVAPPHAAPTDNVLAETVLAETVPIGRVRPAVEAMPAYRPGKGAAQAEAEHGITNAIKLASNENPLPPIGSIQAAVSEAVAGANRYADHRATAVRERLAAKLGVDAEQVTVGAGSVGLLQQLFLTYVDPDDHVVYPWRSFEAYPVYTQLMGGRAITLPLRADLGFDLDAVAAAVTPRTKLVLLSTPNNPTGTALSTTAVRQLVESVAGDVIVVLDEAYREFMDPGLGDPIDELLPDHRNVIVTRTFSKAHGMAGIRVGYAVGDPQVISAVDKTLFPFAVNALAQAAALAALDAADEIDARVGAILSERTRVVDELRGAGWWLPDAQANFVYLRIGEPADRVYLELERQGVVTRPFTNEGIRVTISVPAENDRFLNTLADVLSSLRLDPASISA